GLLTPQHFAAWSAYHLPSRQYYFVVRNLLAIAHAEPECPRKRNMLRLSDIEAFPGIGRIARAPGLRHRRQAHLLPLGVDNLPSDRIERHRIGSEEQRSTGPGEFLECAGTALIDRFQSIQDVEHHLLTNLGRRDHCGDKG